MTMADGADVTAATAEGVPLAANVVDGEPELERGEQIGRYLVIEKIGHGGMGVVYSAYDPELDRKIAIKLLRVRFWHEDGQARARREAQALAQLEHPNVVTVYDVGHVGEQLFLAMELVDGVSLSAWLGAEPRTWKQVVRVMLDVGRGLQAAHDAGIVHRDVKPSNILVCGNGSARIVDFGVASDADSKTAAQGAGDAEGATEVDVAGTPAYMAPEQAEGQATPRSDQFSFCVTLWEALYGYRPEARERDTDWLSSDSSGEQAPPVARLRPHATTAAPRWLRRAVQRGLHADPDRRQPGMKALVAEITPPDTRARVALAATGLSVALAAGLALSLVGAEAPDAARCEVGGTRIDQVWNDAARGRLARAFAATGRSYASETADKMSELLSRRSQTWRQTRREVCRATWVLGEQSEKLLDRRMRCLDRRRGELSSLVELYTHDLNPAMIDHAVSAAASLPAAQECAGITDDVTLEPADPALRDALAGLRAEVDRQTSLRLAGRAADAAELGVGVAARAADLGFAPVEAQSLIELAMAQSAAGRADEAETTLGRTAIAAAKAGDSRIAARTAVRLVYVVGYEQDRRTEGKLLQPLAEAAVLAADGSPEVRAELRAELLTARGGMAVYEGDYAAAHDDMAAALALFEQAWGADDPRMGQPLNNLGVVSNFEEKYERSTRYLERAVDVWTRGLGPSHPDLATALNTLGSAYAGAGQLDKAVATYQRALAVSEAANGADHPGVAIVLSNLGIEYMRMGRLDEALAHYTRALSIREARLGLDHRRTGMSTLQVGEVLAEMGRHDEAMARYRQALERFAKLPPDHRFAVSAHLGLAKLLFATRDLPAAIETFERAHALAKGNASHASLLPDIEFGLARALWDAERQRHRALQLADSARTAWSETGASAELAQATAWLANRR